MMWMDVDTALSEVPVNLIALTDDTDFKSIEASVVYNAAGMTLLWNFTTTAGATTQTAVTPTTAGDYDWVNQGNGFYTLEITASGGASINNDTEGFGYFSGVANGVLPWRGPTIGFRAAAINAAMVNGDGLAIFASKYAGPRGPGIYLNDAAGNTNTVNGTDGTFDNPVSTIAAAKTLADSMSIDRIYLVNDSAITLAAVMADYEIVGIGEMSYNTVNLGSQSVDHSYFENVLISGTQGGTARFEARWCILSGITSMEISALQCVMADGSALVLRNDCMFEGCWSAVAGTGTPVLDINSVADVNIYFRHYSGGIQINNAVATTVMSWEGIGQFIVGATCVSLSIVPRGVVTYTDNGTTTNLLTNDAAINLTNINVDGLGAATGGAINIEATGDNTTRDTIDNAAAVDKGGGLVGIPVTGHAFISGREVTITGTTNYDASYEIISETTNEVVVTATYIAETFAGTETINASVKGIEFVGTITANTYLNTAHKDGATHDMNDVGNVIDIIYIYSIGGGRTGTQVSLFANLSGNSDELVVQAYNFVTSAWETLESLSGSGGSLFVALDPELLNRNTGTGANLADVFIRFATESTSPNSLNVDKIIVAAVNIGQSVGYANGRVWLDTVAGTAGTEPFVNGLGDKHSLTIADTLTLLSAVGLKDVQVINGSTVTLGATVDNRSFFGDNWTLDLDGRSVANAYFQGASSVSGACTASSEVHFEGCDFATATIQLGHFDFCGFGATVTMDLAGDYNWHNCYSKVAGAGAPIFTKTAGQAITGEWRRWSGSITLSGVEAGDVFTISGELGTVTLNGAEGAVEIRGTYKNIVDNRTGTPTLNKDGAIKGVDVANILLDTADMQPKLGTPTDEGGGADLAANLTAIAGRIPAALLDGKMDSLAAHHRTTIATLASQTSFTLTTGSGNNDAYREWLLVVIDATTYTQVAVGRVSAYTGGTLAVTLANDPGIFTMAVGDRVYLYPAETAVQNAAIAALVYRGIKKNTAFSDIQFLMVLASDGRTPAPGKTLTGTRSIDGGAFAAITGSTGEVGNGSYKLDASAADVNGNVIQFRFTAAGCDDTFLTVVTT